ncbi:MAG: aspartate carbamoyltransferase catalytic subunit [Thermoleophilia bacterium]|jgi:aspartate carbamoyltransferase catalytic subunit
MNRHLLSMNDLTREDIESLLATARVDFLDLSKRDIKKVPTLRGRTVIDLFYEKSTRTSTSFELAGKRLSADVINVKADSSAVGKGESLKDTTLTLNAYRPDIIVIRHPHIGAAAFVARFTDAHVINAGDGKGEHPTQCLLDIFSLEQEFGELSGLKVAIVGDVLHSRVARSNIIGFQKMGMKVTLVAPPALLPRGVEALGAGVANSLDALADMDVIYLLRMQKERHEDANYLPSMREYIARYQVGLQHLGAGRKVLHPGPINRGVEISAGLADSEENLILQQVEAGLAVRMAIMYRIIVDNAAAAIETAGETVTEASDTEVKNIHAVG